MLGGPEQAVGRTIQIDRKPYTVIGVMPKGFTFLPTSARSADAAQLWVPMSFTAQELAGRDWYDFDLLAKLRPGVTAGEAETQLSAVTAAVYGWMAKERPELTVSASVTPLAQELARDARQPLMLLMAATGCVLLIACGNIATVLLARASARRREIAFRIALGATRARLMRASLVQDLLVAVMGGGLGIWLAWWGIRFSDVLLPGNIPQVSAIELDRTVLMFSAMLTLATGFLFGIAPAVVLTRVPVSDALKGVSRTALGSQSGRKTRLALITAQIAITAVLLISASLLLRSMLRVLQVNPGIRTENVVTMSVYLPPAQYTTGTQVNAFYRELLERVRRAPAVSAASAATSLPMSGGWKRRFIAEGHPAPQQGQMQLIANSAVMPDYFAVMGIPLRAGRFFTAQEEQSGASVVVISQGMAEQYWPNEDPVGKRIRFSESLPWMTITGVVGDVKQGSLDQNTAPHTYEPYNELGEDGTASVGRDMYVIVRASDATSAIAAVRNGVRELDPQEPVTRIRTMQKILDSTLVPRRFNTALFLAFAVTALLLAALGIYGTVAYSMRQREAEIGLRMALGAQRRQILGLTLREGLRLAAVGTTLGVLAGFAAARLLSGLLYAVAPNDGVSFVAAAIVLIAITMAASYVPARRAMAVDPMTTLRNE